MHRSGRLTMVLLLTTAAATACDDDGGAPADAGGDADAAAFCDEWSAALAAGDDAALLEALGAVPAELEDEARLVREAEATGNGSLEAEEAAAEIVDWTELNCARGEVGASTRRVAAPIDAVPDGLTFCTTLASVSFPPSEAAGMVLYGPSGASDPYDGPMLGLFWNPADQGTHAGDGTTQPVTVRGRQGVAAPITVFQQSILPELGTVVAWTEGERAFGLYGRHWPADRTDELVEVANTLEAAGDGFRIGVDDLPDGYEEVFSGHPSVASLVVPPSLLLTPRPGGQRLERRRARGGDVAGTRRSGRADRWSRGPDGGRSRPR